MKYLLFSAILLLPMTVAAKETAPTDSAATDLREVVVNADSRVETSKKVVLHPTEMERKHSTNGYALLSNMNLPDFIIDTGSKSISTTDGRPVRILINGVDAAMDELSTLAASEIERIDYRRNPGGKYVGCGAVINFITERYDYGGNVYISADEGLARQYGDYISMASYKKNAVTLSLTGSAKWDHASELTSAQNHFSLTDGSLSQKVNPISGKKHSGSEFVNFKFAEAQANHSFDAALSLTASSIPMHIIADDIVYDGLYDFTSRAHRSSREKGLSPALKMHYNLTLAGGHSLMGIATCRFGHTDYRALYAETSAEEIRHRTVENNLLSSVTLGYFKAFSNGLSLGITVDEYHNYYHDTYSGDFESRQTLINNHFMAMMHIDHSLPVGLSYYASAGMTDLYSKIGSHRDNQATPMAFYGLNWAVSPKHSISVNGSYAHSIYNPSYKNDAVIKTSFFEATVGNPELEQLKSFQNFISYNGRLGHFTVSATYDFLYYDRNTSYRYFTDGNTMYRQLVNDGDFSYHKFIISLSADLMDARQRLKGNAIYSINDFNSAYRPVHSDDWRADVSAAYMIGDWELKAAWSAPYSVLGTEGVKFRNPSRYSVSIAWQKGRWAVKANADNIFRKYGVTRTDANYGPYKSLSTTSTDARGRNIGVAITYMLSYGKKTDPEKPKPGSVINSAILKPF